MPLSTGDKLGPYEIVAPLGAGGMGEVWKARDTRLDRVVAIKTSAAAFSERFEREARAVAALTHPHICTLFDVGPDYLVMELVEGAEVKGPLALRTALEYAIQLADAMDAAHRKGIVHRDLKPANVLITKAGVKVLDFGLAKIERAAPLAESDATLTRALTQQGAIVGTLQYMAPEQLQGQPTDARADIFSFGCVLYEMLTGKRAFEGSSTASIIAAIMERPAPSASGVAPPSLDWVLRLCLAKDAGERWQSMRDVRVALERVREAPGDAARPAPALRAPWIAAGVCALAAVVALWAPWRTLKSRTHGPLIQVDLDAGQPVQYPAISPDGTRVVYVAGNDKGEHLATRRLDEASAHVLPDTEGATWPFFSPDGRSVGFFAGGKLKRLSLDGGAATVLTDAEYPAGGMWGDGGTIAAVLGQWSSAIVYRVPAMGGPPHPWTARGPGLAQDLAPYILPGGKRLVYTSRGWNAGFRYALRTVGDEKTESSELLQDASGARYLDGHLVFYRQGRLFASPFDARRLKMAGEAIGMVDDVAEREGIPQFDVSGTGTLVYRRGRATSRVVVRTDSEGKEDRITPKGGGYITPRLSPDGKRLAVVDISGAQPHILIYDLARGSAGRLTLDERAQSVPAWTPDGQYVVYQSTETMLAVRSDGSGQPQPVLGRDDLCTISFSKDGKRAAGARTNPGANQSEIWIAPVERTAAGPKFGKPQTVVSGQGLRDEPVFSPDGRFLAYMSNETGSYHIYVISLTADGRAAGGKWQVSPGTGYNPVWPATGGKLFYDLDTSAQIVAVSYTISGDSFVAALPRPWSPTPISHYIAKMFDIAEDGKLTVGIKDNEMVVPETHLRLILNFGDELHRRFAAAAK